MRIGEFWEEESSLPVLPRPPKKQDVTCTAVKDTEPCTANIDKTNGLIYVIRANAKPEFMGQSVYH